MKITPKTTLQELAFIVCEHLRRNDIEAVLTGGAVVSIYARNDYMSYDLDFITSADRKKIKKAMADIGFEKDSSRYFKHPKTKYFVEFPSPPLAIGNEPVQSWARKKSKAGSLYLLTPTQCVMDRLAAFYHWLDYQSLEQAVLVAKKHKVDLHKVKRWSTKEDMQEKYSEFVKKLKSS